MFSYIIFNRYPYSWSPRQQLLIFIFASLSSLFLLSSLSSLFLLLSSPSPFALSSKGASRVVGMDAAMTHESAVGIVDNFRSQGLTGAMQRHSHMHRHSHTLLRGFVQQLVSRCSETTMSSGGLTHFWICSLHWCLCYYVRCLLPPHLPVQSLMLLCCPHFLVESRNSVE